MVTAIHGDALLDPATGRRPRRAVVLIEGGRVTAAGSRDHVSCRPTPSPSMRRA